VGRATGGLTVSGYLTREGGTCISTYKCDCAHRSRDRCLRMYCLSYSRYVDATVRHVAASTDLAIRALTTRELRLSVCRRH